MDLKPLKPKPKKPKKPKKASPKAKKQPSTLTKPRPCKLPIRPLQPAGHGHTAAWVTALKDPNMDEDDPEVSNASLATPLEEGITSPQLLLMMQSELVDLKTRQRDLEAEIIDLKWSMAAMPQPSPGREAILEPQPLQYTQYKSESGTVPGQLSYVGVQEKVMYNAQGYTTNPFPSVLLTPSYPLNSPNLPQPPPENSSFLTPPHAPRSPIQFLQLQGSQHGSHSLWQPSLGDFTPDFISDSLPPPFSPQANHYDLMLPSWVDPMEIEIKDIAKEQEAFTNPVKRSFKDFFSLDLAERLVVKDECWSPRTTKSVEQPLKKRQRKARRKTLA